MGKGIIVVDRQDLRSCTVLCGVYNFGLWFHILSILVHYGLKSGDRGRYLLPIPRAVCRLFQRYLHSAPVGACRLHGAES